MSCSPCQRAALRKHSLVGIPYVSSRILLQTDKHRLLLVRYGHHQSCWKSLTDTVVPDESSSSTNIKQHIMGHTPTSPRTIFPWRHSSTVLPRINSNSTEFFTQGGVLGPKMPPLNSFTRNLLWLSSCRALQVPFWDIFVSKQYEKQLTDSFVFAFQQAVNGLLVHTFHGKTLLLSPFSFLLL
jgi:hypothetical protein